MTKEIMNKIFEIATGKWAKIFWSVIIVAVIIVLILYPYIDANILVFNRLNQRIGLLERITILDTEKINQNPLLKQEYDAIVSELGTIREKSVANIVAREDTIVEVRVKFIAGGFIFWLVSLVALFSKGIGEGSPLLKRIGQRLFIVGFCVAIGFLLARVGKEIPTLFNVWVNVVLYQIVIIVLVILLIYNGKQEQKK